MPTTASVLAILLEQTDRTRQSSKAEIERFIEESEQKIISLESQICTLVALRDRERACVDSLRHIISPIRTLPIELLIEIFLLAITDNSLRRTIHDRIRDAHHITQLYADGLEGWLARSAPLTVPVSLRLGHRIVINPCTLELLIRIAPPSALLALLDSLEVLDLSLIGTDYEMTERPAFAMVPRLRKMSITIYSDEPDVLIPWAQLTYLTLDCDTLDIILDIMTHCTALTHASIGTRAMHNYIGAHRPLLALCHLHTLSLQFICSELMVHFLGSVSAPALQELHLNASDLSDSIQFEKPLAFLVRSPNITRLDVRCGSVGPTSHEVIVVLRHTPRLTHLELHDRRSLDDTLFDVLSYKAGVAPLVPHLHSLVLDRVVDPDGFAEEALEHMLASRWQADGEVTSGPPTVARWSYVGVGGYRYSEQLMNTVEMLQRKGLPLELI
ncbi:F-box domain-containing protein [Mycena sanguinolenta]|uniref:F-box domain-containing protein n=1 Tax=Mycena sanguinolenta TaxID=230812 RepID=A0A8H7D0Z3_9AGAR|nr:F-box domain-containing protein [Mycena sanguinolenta]